MGKNNKQRRKQKKRKGLRREEKLRLKKAEKSNQGLGPSLSMMKNPLSTLSDEQRRHVILKIGEENNSLYQSSLDKIGQIITEYNAIGLIAVLASYGLSIGVTDNGIKVKDSEAKLHQSHLEILQGLLLQRKPSELGKKPFRPGVVQELWDALTDLMNSNALKSIGDTAELVCDEHKAISLLQARIRGNTQMVRNWGYFSQVTGMSRELYTYFDECVLASCGYSVSMIFELFELLISEIEHRNTTWYSTHRKLLNLKDSKKLVYEYHKLIGESVEQAERFIESIDISSVPYQELFFMLVSHGDQERYLDYVFSSESVADSINIDTSVANQLLDNFSLNLGELAEFNPDFLYLSNPVWLKPLIKLNEGSYLCVLPQVFFSFVLQSLDSFLTPIVGTALSVRRAEYLENKVASIIQSRFPEARVITGFSWKLDGIQYETDIIVFIDSHMIIVEAKSGSVSTPALRGAQGRLKKHIEELLEAPNIQSKRLKQRLETLISDPSIDDELRDSLPVNLNQIHKIIRLSVTLEDFGAIQSNVYELIETGWLDDDFEPCPTMNLADLETLFDFLDHPVQIIHYLEVRHELERAIGYMGDELDLMGLYRSTLFNLGDVGPDVNFIMSEMSADLDRYYMSRDEGVDVEKPRPYVSALFENILKQLEARKTPRWTEIGVILNRFSPDDQVELTRMIERLKRNVRREWKDIRHKNMVIIIPPQASEYALCYIVYSDNTANRKDEFIQVGLATGLEAPHVKQCLVIASNMDSSLAYDYLCLGNKE